MRMRAMKIERTVLMLLLGILLVSPSACCPELGPTPTPTPTATEEVSQWVSYHNPVYGYTIDYPSDWELSVENFGYVEILPPPDKLAFVSIAADDYPLSLDESVALLLDAAESTWGHISNVTIYELSNWERAVTYEHSWEGMLFCAQAYILQTRDYTFTVWWDAIKDGTSPNLCRDIVATFTVD